MTMQDHDQDYLWDRREAILYRVQLSALYHRKRERFFDFLDRLTKAVSIIGASAAFSNLGGTEWVRIAAAVVAVTSTIGLVFGLSERARRHSDLANKFLMIEAGIEDRGERGFQEDDLNKWTSDFSKIGSAEPPALRALIILCQNELAISRNQPSSTHSLSLWRRPFVHWI